MLTADTEQVAYSGSNFGQTSFKSNPHKYAIGLFHKAKKQCTLADVNHVYSLQPQLKNAEFDTNVGMDASLAEGKSTQEVYMIQNRSLHEQFGSRKKQRQLASKAANRVVIEAGAAVTAVESALDVTEKLAEAKQAAAPITPSAQLLPPHDPLASVPEDIFQIETVLPAEELKALDFKSLLDAAVNKNQQALSTYSHFIGARAVEVVACLSEEEPAERKRLLRALVYLYHLLAFYNLPRGKKDNGLSELDCSDAMRERFMVEFLDRQKTKEGSRLVFGSEQAHKLMCHIAVAALLSAGDRKLDKTHLELLAQDLKVSVANVVLYMKHVGCAATRDKAHLMAPLKLPEIKPPRQRAKKK